MKKKILVSMIAGLIMATMSITSYAMTAEEVTTKNPTSYTAGTNSVYGPSLSQEQLNAVAQATADFMTNNITDSMSTDQKIKAAYDYIKTRTTYVDWNAATGANTAYTLVTGQGACSGMCRSMKALCDAMGIECYHIHSTSNDHQWNLIRYGDGVLYHVDIDANKSAGQDIIYKSLTHPLPYDTSAYPAVGQAQEQTTQNGWQEENGKWYYYENGNRAENKWIGGLYYVGSDGAMLTNTTTPDGYKVGADGVWVQAGTQSGNIGGKTMRASDDRAVSTSGCTFGDVPWPQYAKEMHNNISCTVLDDSINSFKFLEQDNLLDPTDHEVWVIGYTFYNGQPFAIGEPVISKFEYNKTYSLDFTGSHPTADSLSNYCKNNNIILQVNIVDKRSGFEAEHNSVTWTLCYATSNSIPTGEITQ